MASHSWSVPVPFSLTLAFPPGAGLAEAHAVQPSRPFPAARRPPHLSELPVQHQRGDHAPTAVHDGEKRRGERVGGRGTVGTQGSLRLRHSTGHVLFLGGVYDSTEQSVVMYAGHQG